MTGLVLDAVSRSFGGVDAVLSLTLTLEPGMVFALCGPNGAGKTTAVNLASGLVAPTGGRIVVDGRDLTGRSARTFARSGVVRTFQSVRLFEGMTALENVLVGAHRSRPTPMIGAVARLPRFRRGESDLRESSLDALRLLGIEPLADRVVGELSHGQRRRVELARALAARPRYLVLDEPGAGVDPGTVDVLVGVITDLAAAGVGILLVEHDRQLLARVSQRAIALVAGAVVKMGSFAEVAAQVDIAAQLAAGG